MLPFRKIAKSIHLFLAQFRNRDHFSIEIKNEKYVIDVGFDDIENYAHFRARLY